MDDLFDQPIVSPFQNIQDDKITAEQLADCAAYLDHSWAVITKLRELDVALGRVYALQDKFWAKHDNLR